MIWKSFIRGHAGILCCSVLFLFAGLLRLNDISLLTPDSSRYLIWGTSLGRGEGFVDATQPTPDRYVVHSPLYSVLIAPVEAVFPMGITAAKVWTLLWGIFALLILYALLLKCAGRPAAILGAIIFACNPLFLVYSTEVLSEAPFLACLLGALLLLEKITESPHAAVGTGLLLVLAVTAAALLREIGIALVAASVLFLFAGRRRMLALGVLALPAALLVLWYLRNTVWIGAYSPEQTPNMGLVFQRFLTPPDSPFPVELALRVKANILEYAQQLGGMLLYPLYATSQLRLIVSPSWFQQALIALMPSLRYLVMPLVLALAGFGIYRDFRRSKSAMHRVLLGALLLGGTLVYPVSDVRFLLPLVPLVIYYVASGCGWWLEKKERPLPGRRASVSIALLAAVVMIPNISPILDILSANQEYRQSPEAMFKRISRLSSYPLVYTQPWSMMGEWISSHLSDTAVIASPAKDLATVVGPRKVLEIEHRSPLPTFEKLLRDNAVGYLLAPSRRKDFKLFQLNMAESRRFRFERIKSISNLHLYSVCSRLRDSCPVSAQPETLGTDRTSVLLWEGRKRLLNEEYEEAARIFGRVLATDSTHPELLYQMVLARALEGDSAAAEALYGRLYSVPQAMGYVVPARAQIEEMEKLAVAESQKFPPSRAVQMFDAATFYWNMGYPRRAASIMNRVLENDSTYFVGLLWGFHFNLQLGDTLTSRKYFLILENMDAQNPVVMNFREILNCSDSLKEARTPAERSLGHWRIGRCYQRIELDEEALDEAEQSLREVPGNVQALLLMAEVFEHKKCPRMALRAYRQAALADPSDAALEAKADSIQRVISGS
jgi:tetratricopeptide (TPR) repeat protein/4-amino-4-deoxy-L-arabinose transferase-like glycosyltransferase